MTLTIYLEHKFAILTAHSTRITLSLNENGSILRGMDGVDTTYHSLEDLLLDTKLSVQEKWMAKGLVGIPDEIKIGAD